MKNDDPSVPNVIKRLAHLLGTEVKNRKLEIPERFGTGHCAGFVFNAHIRMLICNYELNENLIINNPDVDVSKRTLFFKFQNIFPKEETLPSARLLTEMPSVLIATSRINTDEVIAIHSNAATINIEVNADYLSELFDLPQKSPVLQSLLQNTQPLLFEQLIYPSLENIVNEILTEQVDETFKLFFLRIKAEELICRLLMELEERDEKHLYALNSADIQTIYRIKEQMIERLDRPPVIKEIAVHAGMSPTKLKRLFKQIFGDSIFSYYQNFRMKKAALLLEKESLSVSDVGYRLGFTNLSHFSRVFEEHIGMKPKQYSRFRTSLSK